MLRRKSARWARTQLPEAHRGVWCCEIELSGDTDITSPLPLGNQQTARVLVRLHGQPMGYVEMPLSIGRPEVGGCIALAWRQLQDPILAHLQAEGMAANYPTDHGWRAPTARWACPNRVTSSQLVSVVVCTRDRGEAFQDCLSRLQNLTYPELEVIIVDNAPADDTTHDLVQAVAAIDHRFRYVLEPRPGLSCARNRGLREAKGTYLAYTDDDVMVDPGWIEGVVRGFHRDTNVGCVTGLVCTASITNASEAYFDARSPSWSARCEPEIFDLVDHRREGALYPYSAGIFGTGANCAFDRSVLSTTGPFDEALGAGTKTRGGEDLDMFLRVLQTGSAVVYEPAAVVWHHHRADPEALLRQMFGYGSGMTAFIFKCIWQRSTRSDVLRRILPGFWRMFAIRSDTETRLAGKAKPPRGALRREIAGYAAGPLLYIRSRRNLKRAWS